MHRIFAIFTVFFALLHCVPTVADDTEIDVSTDEEVELAEIDPETEAAQSVYMQMGALAWCPNEEDENPGHPDERVQKLCEQLKEAYDLQAELDANLDELTDNAKAMRDKEQSFENRMLGGATTAATGLGMMTAASARAEQKADAAAEQDMATYLATFKCEYGRGQNVKAGNEEVTLPGGNELLEYYSEYKALAESLKKTKAALGLRPGIETEIVYDKAQSNLYKYASTGITDGAYTSLSRALTDAEGKDAADWNEQKEKSAKNLKTGLIATGAGVVGGIAGNYLINKNGPKDRSEELLAKRRDIKSNYDTLVTELVDECNQIIMAHKESVRNLSPDKFNNNFMRQYKQDVEAAQPVTSLQEINESKFCR